MDEVAELRADLRSYAVRRCMRVYTGIIVAAVLAVGRMPQGGEAGDDWVGMVGPVLFGVLAAIELSSAMVMAQIQRLLPVREGEGVILRLARGWAPSVPAFVLFVTAAVVFAII